jgi:hypothetical protein
MQRRTAIRRDLQKRSLANPTSCQRGQERTLTLKTTERYLHSSDKLKQAAVGVERIRRCLPSEPESPVAENAVSGRVN